MKDLLHTITAAPWMMAPATARAYLPSVLKLIQGEPVQFQEHKKRQPVAYRPGFAPITYGGYDDELAPGTVMVYPVIGAVTKYGGWCASGTEDMMVAMRNAEKDERIAGHMIEIDSGGGEGTNLQTFARFIREELGKPVVAWFNGTAASAAYWIAAAADEIYASEDTDVVGSIGVLVSFMDFREYYENKGIKLHEVYAEQSDLKNQDWKKALNGDYDELREEFLNPYAESFINSIQKLRPELRDINAYRGKTYMAANAPAGMIDGMLTYDQAVARVIELSGYEEKEEDDDSIMSINYMSNMNRVESVLGTPIELHEGGAFLTEEQLQAINANLVDDNHEAVHTDTITDLRGEIGTLRTELENEKTVSTQLGETIEALDRRIEKLEKGSAEPPTGAFSQQDPGAQHHEDELEKFEREMRAAAKSGNAVFER